MKPETLPDRLTRRIVVEAEPHPELGSPCWRWVGRLNRNGYGRAWDPVRRCEPVTHRLVFEIVVGPVPPGLVLDHRCRVRACCNPRHMEAVTQAENVHRGDAVLFGARPPHNLEIAR